VARAFRLSNQHPARIALGRWSAVSRMERYKKRLEDNGEDVSLMGKLPPGGGAPTCQPALP
jgi:hypothetical protein